MNDKFLSDTFKIMIPIAIQNLIFSGLGMVDTLMIGQLGEETIAGVSLANQFFFVLTLMYFGITGGAAIFASQFWGARKTDEIINIYGVALKLGVIIGIIFTIAGIFFPTIVLSLFTNDETVILLGSSYLRIVAACYIFSGISFITTGVLRSIGQIKHPVIISAVSLLVNTIINYLLILGSFGFPKLGIQGAAIATLISRVLELVLLFLMLKIKKSPLLILKISDFFLKKSIKRKFYSTVLPVVINETMWSVGAATFSAIYARISTGSVAAYQIQQTITTIFLIFVFGIGNASGILIGNKLGESNREETYAYGIRFLKMSAVIGLITGVIVATVGPFMTGLFNVSPEVIISSKRLIYIFCVVLVFKSINITMVVGILRGGGDTKTAMYMDIFGVWGIGIPLGLFGSFVLK